VLYDFDQIREIVFTLNFVSVEILGGHTTFAQLQEHLKTLSWGREERRAHDNCLGRMRTLPQHSSGCADTVRNADSAVPRELPPAREPGESANGATPHIVKNPWNRMEKRGGSLIER
jgi:hypothetical protein